MSDATAVMMNGLLLVGGASVGYALHSTIVTGEFSPLFATGLGSLTVWLAVRGAGDGEAPAAESVEPAAGERDGSEGST